MSALSPVWAFKMSPAQFSLSEDRATSESNSSGSSVGNQPRYPACTFARETATAREDLARLLRLPNDPGSDHDEVDRVSEHIPATEEVLMTHKSHKPICVRFESITAVKLPRHADYREDVIRIC
jgi:hypothetical protein